MAELNNMFGLGGGSTLKSRQTVAGEILSTTSETSSKNHTISAVDISKTFVRCITCYGAVFRLGSTGFSYSAPQKVTLTSTNLKLDYRTEYTDNNSDARGAYQFEILEYE